MLPDRLDGFLGDKNKVSEKAKESQYVLPDAPTNSLSTLVSNALDRLQSAGDACVKYDTETKMWVYLHGDRTEESLTFFDVEGPATWEISFIIIITIKIYVRIHPVWQYLTLNSFKKESLNWPGFEKKTGKASSDDGQNGSLRPVKLEQGSKSGDDTAAADPEEHAVNHVSPTIQNKEHSDL